MLESLYTWLLLPLGAALGWVYARRTPSVGTSTPADAAPPPLGALLTQLTSDDPDHAIAVLTQATQMDNATAELHLTLGSLFRKRGEVDRALRIHEALLARSGLSPQVLHRARFELAQDYLKAGVMDRAEQLFEELASQGLYVAEALEEILGIYEQGRDWKQAIETARRLEAAKGESQSVLIAQYCCELAEEQQRAQKLPEAIKLARRALDESADCVRASLLLGKLLLAQQDYAGAIKAYRRAYDQDARFLPELLEPFAQSCEKAGDAEAYLSFLADAKETGSSALPLIAEARLMRETHADPTAHLVNALQSHPSRALMVELLDALAHQPGIAAAGLQPATASLRDVLHKLGESSPRYQCRHCGFTPRLLFWQCPSCKRWGTTVPVEDTIKR